MQLASRITLAACLALLALAGLLLGAGLQRESVAADRLAESRVQGASVIWRMLVDRRRAELSDAADLPRAARDALAFAAEEEDRAAIAAILANPVARWAAEHRIDHVDVVGPSGALLFTTSTAAQPAPLLDAGLAEDLRRGGQPQGGLQLDSRRRFTTAWAEPLRVGDQVVGILTLAGSVDPLLAELAASLGGQAYLVSLRGRLLHGADLPLWQAMGLRDGLTADRLNVRHHAGRSYVMIKAEVSDATGRTAAALVTVLDETASLAAERRIEIATYAGAAIGTLLIVALLYWLLATSFRPLHEAIAVLNALSRGDTSVRIEAREATDEIGRIAAAVHLFRDYLVTLSDLRDQQTRMRRRQERFIRRQMMELASTLDEKPRQEVMRDLDEIVALGKPGGEVAEDDQLGLLGVVLKQMSDRVRDQQKVRDTFGKYIDPRIVEQLIDEPSLGGERRVMSVAFTDLQGFTALSEQSLPTTLVSLLNEYLSLMSEAIFESSGIVDKYIGDAVMAFWGPPFTSEVDHAVAACRAALEQRVMIEEFRRRVPAVLGPHISSKKIDIRCGIASGELVVGSVGSERSRNYTVLGDTVNIAARLEGANKAYGTRILLSGQTFELARHAIVAREVDLVGVVGRQEPVRIYELFGLQGAVLAEQAQLAEQFDQGLRRFRARDWSGAETVFNAVLELQPDDGPSRLMLERIQRYRIEPPPDGWVGDWRLTEK